MPNSITTFGYKISVLLSLESKPLLVMKKLIH